MNAPACGRVNEADFVLTMSPDKSTSPKAPLPVRAKKETRQWRVSKKQEYYQSRYPPSITISVPLVNVEASLKK